MADSNINSIFKEVAQKAPIKDVIEYELGHNAVVKKGKEYACICPFHDDHSPSMMISVSRNTFKCFVDGEGGNPIDFVAKYRKLSPIEALKRVCQICSIELPDSFTSKSNIDSFSSKYEKELKALNELSKFYQVSLMSKEGSNCREYLKLRKIPDDCVSHFNLGYALNDSTVSISALRKLNYEVSTLEKAGILSSSSSLSDRFSNRLMYPIEDNYGRIVGFSGRIIVSDKSQAKYVNYPATTLFNKSQILYHYYQAKQVCSKYGYVYVVEGFNDVIAFYRAGITSVVGLMGTALTEENLQALKKLNVEVRLCLDSDEPGQNASEEICELLYSHDINFRIVRAFKDGKDADEILAKFDPYGAEELNKLAKKLYDPFMFLLSRELLKSSNHKELKDPLVIQNFINKSKKYYEKLNSVSKIDDLKILAKVTNISEDKISKIYDSVESIIEKPIIKKTEYRKYEHKKKDNIFLNKSNLSQRYNVVNNISDYFNYTLALNDNEKLNDEILKLEIQIISVLPHSIEAMKLFQDNQVNIEFEPYYCLPLLFSQIYQNDKSLTKFSFTDYQKVKDYINDYSPENEKEGDEDDFDFDIEDLSNDDYGVKINSNHKEFLLKTIDVISQLDDKFYGKTQLISCIKAHNLLCSYYARKRYCESNKIDLIMDKDLLTLKIKLKRYNYNL